MSDDIQKIYKYTISQTKKMEKLLKKDVKEIYKKAAEDIINKLKVFYNQYWANRYSPEDYERTHTFVKSIKYENSSDTDIYIYFDQNELKRIKNVGGWGSYTNFQGDPSFTTEETFFNSFVEYIETGYFGSNQTGGHITGNWTNPRIGDGSYFIERTLKWLNRYMQYEVERKIGLKIDNLKLD